MKIWLEPGKKNCQWSFRAERPRACLCQRTSNTGGPLSQLRQKQHSAVLSHPRLSEGKGGKESEAAIAWLT